MTKLFNIIKLKNNYFKFKKLFKFFNYLNIKFNNYLFFIYFLINYLLIILKIKLFI